MISYVICTTELELVLQLEVLIELVLQLAVLMELELQLEVLEWRKIKASNTAEGRTWTFSHKAVLGLCWFSWTRPAIFVTSPSPDIGSLATSSRTFGPFSPFLPFACFVRTLIQKAIFGLCWFSWTRTVIFAARPSPDSSSLATSSRTLSPWTPFLPFAYDYWTLIQKAIFGLCPLPWTRTVTSNASSSPDSGSIATWKRAVGPFAPSLPLAFDFWFVFEPYTLLFKAISYLWGLSWTRSSTSTASASPDFRTLATRSWALGPFFPLLVLARNHWLGVGTRTRIHKAIGGLCGLSGTRSIAFVASSSPDFQPFATWTGALGPFTPSLPFLLFYTLIQKAIFGLCPPSWRTRPFTSTASSSPDFGALATSCRAMGPFTPLLPSRARMFHLRWFSHRKFLCNFVLYLSIN